MECFFIKNMESLLKTKLKKKNLSPNKRIYLYISKDTILNGNWIGLVR